jgi:uncharacterized protein YcfJ
MMKQFLTIAAIAGLSIFATEKAMAQDTIQAPIVSKVAQYIWAKEYIGTDQVCRTVYVKEEQGKWNDGVSGAIKGDGDAIAGAIIGGLIGNQFGGGTGKDVMTGLGVIVGSNVAKGTANRRGGTIKRTICDDVPQYQKVKEITGYNVTYMYQGMHYKAFFNEDPGTHVTLELKTTHSVRN